MNHGIGLIVAVGDAERVRVNRLGAEVTDVTERLVTALLQDNTSTRVGVYTPTCSATRGHRRVHPGSDVTDL